MKRYQSLWWVACAPLLFCLSSLGAEQIAVVKDARVNVRGQPSLVGEVITQLQKGEKVLVLEEMTVAKPKTNEPARWARIQMPANTPVWLNASFIDPATHTVKVNRLNLRAGPGENYSVVGRLPKGTSVNEIRRVEDWMEIETPVGAYGFVAADLLTTPELATATTPSTPPPKAVPPAAQTNRPAAIAAAPVPPVGSQTPPSTESAQSTPAPSSPPPLTVPPIPSASSPATKIEQSPAIVATPVVPTPPSAAGTQVKKAVEAPGKRIVRREGLVRSTTSIQAPTYYELLALENHKTINYLHTDKIGVDLKDYHGRTIIVTGEEAIDPRWPKTPVIEVESLELIP